MTLLSSPLKQILKNGISEVRMTEQSKISERLMAFLIARFALYFILFLLVLALFTLL